MYSGLVNNNVHVASAKFLSNEYETDMFVVNESHDIGDDSVSGQEFVNPLMSYIVKKDDTLDIIARKYAVSVDQIKTVNNILDPDLKI
jgi:LysM repeat protein